MDLRELLYQNRLKQSDLVKLLGVDPSRISLFVNGIRPLPKKYHSRLAKALGITPEALLVGKSKGVK